MNRSSVLLVASCLLALGGLAGCGSDDPTTSPPVTTATAAATSDAPTAQPTTAEPTTTPTSTAPDSSAGGLTKAQFLAKGNAICKAGNAEVEAAFMKLGQTPTHAQIEKVAVDTLIPSVKRQIAAIRALGIPASEKPKVEALLRKAEADLKTLAADPSVLNEQGNDPFEQTNKDLSAYGLTTCGS